MLFYWTVFTTTDTPNKYLDMFAMSYTSFLTHNIIQPTDSVVLLCDPTTAARANQMLCLRKVKIVVAPKPSSVFEGLFLRYRLHQHFSIDYGTECAYIDTDMICLRPFRISCPPSTVFVYPEGPPTDSNYCGDMTLNLPYGASSTFFVYNFCPIVKCFLEAVKGEKHYYTMDQVYFNKAIESYQQIIHPIAPQTISFNGHSNKDTALFLNLAGEPGNETVHWTKMLDIYLLLESQRPSLSQKKEGEAQKK